MSDLLDSAPDEAPVPAARRRGRWPVVAAAGIAAAVAVLTVALPLHPSAGPTLAAGGSGPVSNDSGPAANGSGPVPNGSGPVPNGSGPAATAGTGDTVCGDVRFDGAKLPGRTVTPDNGDWPTAAAADLLSLHGWPRAVPFDVARWTVVATGTGAGAAGVLVTFLPGSGFHYLPIHAAAGGGWTVGAPCTPH